MTVKHMLEATRWRADWASSRGLTTHDRLTMFPLLISSSSSYGLKLTCDGDNSLEEEEFVLLFYAAFPLAAVRDAPSSALGFSSPFYALTLVALLPAEVGKLQD